MRAAIPMELVHAGALVHDDVMDNSDLRRGNPTVHKIFEKEMGERGSGSVFGHSCGRYDIGVGR